jgi:predicted nucleotidyltransferase
MDANVNGKIDTWSYMDGARIVRIEVDQDEDGTIDRWEHYDSNQQLSRVGVSRLNDGKVTRTEHYDQGVLVRADEDTDGDGTLDKWETYDAGRLATVAFDTSRGGRPDRRLVYGGDGSARLEIADDRGQFTAMKTSSGQAPSAR